MRNWLPVIIIALLVLLWGQLIYRLVGDRPRAWDYGATPYIPADSTYTTQEPPIGQPEPPRQIAPIPQPQATAPVPGTAPARTGQPAAPPSPEGRPPR